MVSNRKDLITMVTNLDKEIVLDEIVGYDGPWEKPYDTFASTYAEEKDPIINDYMIENIINEMLKNGGCSRLTLYPMIKKLVGELKGDRASFQLIDNVSWTSDDIFDVIQMIGKTLLPKLKKKLKGRNIFCRVYEDGVLEFRLEK